MRVMLVEDNTYFRGMVKCDLLSRFPSMEVIEVEDGKKALQELESIPIDLIFMDIRLPGQNGLELTRRIRADRRDITIIVVSSYNLPEYREAALLNGGDCFIPKDSFNLERISSLIACLEKAKKNGNRKCACFRLLED